MRTLSIALFVAALGTLAGCGDSAPASGAPSGAGSAAGSGTAKAATPAKAAAPAAIAGIKAGEMLAASCNTIAKDSECGDVVVMAEGDKAKTVETLKQICNGGAVTENACPADKLVGTCRVMKDIINHYYSEGGKAFKSADDAKAMCEKSHGTWVAP